MPFGEMTSGGIACGGSAAGGAGGVALSEIAFGGPVFCEVNPDLRIRRLRHLAVPPTTQLAADYRGSISNFS